jgi:hypothetical protein
VAPVDQNCERDDPALVRLGVLEVGPLGEHAHRVEAAEEVQPPVVGGEIVAPELARGLPPLLVGPRQREKEDRRHQMRLRIIEPMVKADTTMTANTESSKRRIM